MLRRIDKQHPVPLLGGKTLDEFILGNQQTALKDGIGYHADNSQPKDSPLFVVIFQFLANGFTQRPDNGGIIAHRRDDVLPQVSMKQIPPFLSLGILNNLGEREGAACLQPVRLNAQQSRPLRSIQVETACIIPVAHAQLHGLDTFQTSIVQADGLSSGCVIQVMENADGGLAIECEASRSGIAFVGAG